MDTGRMTLLLTLDADCSSVKFTGECDGEPTIEQNGIGAAIYAAIVDIINDEDVLMHYLALASAMADEEEEEEKKPKQFELKLVH
jgi:hypothetical protein|tara:strand:- start:393 stop:647 length:255 start_codon:yes stop_codon:yes gene_type:complete